MEVVQILTERFTPWALLADFEAAHLSARGRWGAAAVFIGTMRDHNEGDAVRGMVLEHYPEMTQKELTRLRAEAMTRWPLTQLFIAHRVGRLAPGETIMVVAAWSDHRHEAQAACAHVVEELKARAPFWKKETLATGERWVNPRG